MIGKVLKTFDREVREQISKKKHKRNYAEIKNKTKTKKETT
jgi:hypothetical protein